MLLKQEPKEYVYKDKDRRAHKEDKKTRGELIPHFLPFYVLGLLLEEFNAFVPNIFKEIANLSKKLSHFTNLPLKKRIRV